MTRELLILRHGKSDWTPQVSDFYRPLKNRGKRGAQRIGEWLWTMDLRPDLIISSAAERALSTAHKCCKAMDLRVGDRIVEDRRLYLASLTELLEVLAGRIRAPARVMLVGHNPGLEDLLEYLAAGSVPVPADGKLLSTATLAVLSMPEKWNHPGRGCARLNTIVRARDLPDGFGFPGPGGDEMRDRPAYYYCQSAVIPYRNHTRAGLQFLVIGSSKKRHWVMPKGICEPGMTSQDSAAREAWEEAGIRGIVAARKIGTYRVKKWGAECSVDVYPMEVTEMAATDEWEESHRSRRWLSAEQAMACLRQKELADLVGSLARRLEA